MAVTNWACVSIRNICTCMSINATKLCGWQNNNERKPFPPFGWTMLNAGAGTKKNPLLPQSVLEGWQGIAGSSWKHHKWHLSKSRRWKSFGRREQELKYRRVARRNDTVKQKHVQLCSYDRWQSLDMHCAWGGTSLDVSLTKHQLWTSDLPKVPQALTVPEYPSWCIVGQLWYVMISCTNLVLFFVILFSSLLYVVADY